MKKEAFHYETNQAINLARKMDNHFSSSRVSKRLSEWATRRTFEAVDLESATLEPRPQPVGRDIKSAAKSSGGRVLRALVILYYLRDIFCSSANKIIVL